MKEKITIFRDTKECGVKMTWNGTGLTVSCYIYNDMKINELVARHLLFAALDRNFKGN